MLSPDQIDAAGDAVAAVYSQIEAEMLDRLVSTMLTGDVLGQKDLTALVLLSQTHATSLMGIVESHRQDIDRAVMQTAVEMLGASDKDDIERIGEGSPLYPKQVQATVAGIAAVLARDNLGMAEGARQAFLDASVEAVTRVNVGVMTAERALHSAVRRLERGGVPVVTYQNSTTGAVTVRNKVDVAVRRHVRTQIAQDGARMTLDRMSQLDVALVEVSSHTGARPSHAEWHGRCYSLRGDVEIDGVRYRDFYEATRYGSVDGLLGANCRHSFGPYRHGAPRAYGKDPGHESGLPNSEVYELSQQQRAAERRIREAKREVRGAQQAHDQFGTLESKAELAKAQARLRESQAGMRSLIELANSKSKTGRPVLRRHPNREWAGDMPKSPTIKTSGRKLDDFLGGDAVTSKLSASGISKASARNAIRKELAERDLSTQDFAVLSASDQQGMLRDVMTRKKPTSREVRRASYKQVNDALYNSQKNYVERHGGIVMRGGEDVEKHLDRNGADGSCIGGIVMLREDATTSEVLEEVFHFKQEQRGDYSELNGRIAGIRREIDAQYYLLSVSERYSIPELEIEITKSNLDYYEKTLKRLEGE